jgi:thiamine-phosphate pyrophosphorylase
LIDQSGSACEIARNIAKKAPAIDGIEVQIEAEVGAVATSVDRILARGKASFDLVLMGQVLAELDPDLTEPERVEKHAVLIVDALRRLVRPGGSLVIIEPALKATSRHLQSVRDALVNKFAPPFAPCLHASTCPALVREGDWCHEDLDVDLPTWLVPVARAAGLRFEGLTFSYLVLRADGSALRDLVGPSSVRAVSSLLVSKGKQELLLCDPTPGAPGLLRSMRLDRERSSTNETWSDLRRGDVVDISPTPTHEAARVHADARISFAPVVAANTSTVSTSSTSRVLPKRGLYALVDTISLTRAGIDAIAYTRAVLAGRPALVQLRAKDRESGDHLALLRKLVTLCRAAGVPLFANDRTDLALLAGCDGVHVGQDDMPIDEVRKIAPGLLIGVSTHTPEQFAKALLARPEYVAFGPVFETSSKEHADPVVGLDRLRDLVKTTDLPVVAIGGITLERAPEIASSGAIGAVIGALVPENKSLDDVTARVLAMSSALGQGKA